MPFDMSPTRARGSYVGDLERRISAREILVTLFGYVWRNQRSLYLPSAAIVDLLADFEVTAASARTSLSRLYRERTFDSRKSGRNTYYRVSDATRSRTEANVRKILSFGTHDELDGRWTMVVFSFPKEHSEARNSFRDALRRRGFAPFFDAVWIAPGDRRELALNEVAVKKVKTASVFLVDEAAMTSHGRLPIDSWDLDRIAAAYRELAELASGFSIEASAGDMPPSRAFVNRTNMLSTFRRIVPLDPGLPTDRMPAGWPRREARAEFVRAFDLMGPIAEVRVKHLVAEYDDELATQVGALTATPFDALRAVTPDALMPPIG